MDFIKQVLNLLYSFYLENKNLYIFLFGILPILLSVSYWFQKKKNNQIVVFSILLLYLFGASLTYFLFRLNIIDIYLLCLEIILDLYNTIVTISQLNLIPKNKFFILKGFHIRKYVLYQLLSCLSGIYALISIHYFDNIQFVKYGLIFLYVFYFFYYIKTIKIHNNYIKIHDDAEVGMNIVSDYTGSAILSLPVTILLNVKLYWFFVVISLVPKIEKSKISRGIFDISNRSSLLVYNNDIQRQLSLILISITILISRGFDLESCFYVFLIVGIWQLLSYSRQTIPKYFTSVTGEISIHKPDSYDGLLTRVMTDRDILKRNTSKQTFSYALFFNNFKYIYDSSKGIVESAKIIERSNHVILIFNKNESTINFICENDLNSALKNPFTIVDTWESNFSLKEYYPKIDSGYNWLNARLNLLQKITDESFLKLDGEISSKINSDTKKINAQNTLVRVNISNSSSFESLRQNISLLENNFNDNDHEALKVLYGQGIFELNTLYRQLHESPSIPSRFIDLLNISECISRYLCGFCFASRSVDDRSIHRDLTFNTKAISFGTCIDYLARWKKKESDSSITILDSKIKEYLDISYLDSENVDNLISFLKSMNPNAKVKYSRKPAIIDLMWWLVAIRNKTRGHGTPSKVDFQFYICLEKVTLFLLSEVSKLNFAPAIRTKIDDQEWTIDLSWGGLPVIVPVVNDLEKSIHLNPLLNEKEFEKYKDRHFDILANISENEEQLYLKVSQDDKFEWWRCKDYFKVKNGVVFILNQRTDSTESWISFSTGKIMRPEISDL
jgi:hypothetical protein